MKISDGEKISQGEYSEAARIMFGCLTCKEVLCTDHSPTQRSDGMRCPAQKDPIAYIELREFVAEIRENGGVLDEPIEPLTRRHAVIDTMLGQIDVPKTLKEPESMLDILDRVPPHSGYTGQEGLMG